MAGTGLGFSSLILRGDVSLAGCSHRGDVHSNHGRLSAGFSIARQTVGTCPASLKPLLQAPVPSLLVDVPAPLPDRGVQVLAPMWIMQQEAQIHGMETLA